MPENTTGDSESPIGWYLLAEAYLHDAALLHNTEKPRGGHHEAPVRFLYFHAIELFLKAFLRLKGLEDKALRKDYSHYLTPLADEAQQNGLAIGKRVRTVCEAATDFDNPQFARYLKTGFRRQIAPVRLYEAGRDLRAAVHKAFRDDGSLMQPLQRLPPVHSPRRSLTVAQAAKLLPRR